MRLLLVLMVCFMGGCAATTRDMQEQTQVNLTADTPIGPIKLTGNINRTQHETTELKLKAPEIFKQVVSSGFGMMTGGMGVAGLAYGLITSVKARRRKEDHLTVQGSKDEQISTLAKDRDVYLREMCNGIRKWMSKADDVNEKALRQSMREAMSQSTRDAVRDFI